MRTEADVARMAFPRAAALAEVGWSAPERKDWADFTARLPAELTRYPRRWASIPTPARLRQADAAASGRRGDGDARQPGWRGTLHYRRRAPRRRPRRSNVAPIPVADSVRLRAASFIGGRKVSPELGTVASMWRPRNDGRARN